MRDACRAEKAPFLIQKVPVPRQGPHEVLRSSIPFHLSVPGYGEGAASSSPAAKGCSHGWQPA